MEIDAASNNGVDNVRQINDAVRYSPVSARYKVYIVDEVHMLSAGAFNAFLKTLEEPPPHAKFIFATTEINKVPVTILSRCQRFDLRRIEADTLIAHLEKICRSEGVEAEADALAAIARAGEGSARDSLSLLDQAIAMAPAASRPTPCATCWASPTALRWWTSSRPPCAATCRQAFPSCATNTMRARTPRWCWRNWPRSPMW
jgi:DNA polymerase III subunit gamma/tau